jgi:hypothetical protein
MTCETFICPQLSSSDIEFKCMNLNNYFEDIEISEGNYLESGLFNI